MANQSPADLEAAEVTTAEAIEMLEVSERSTLLRWVSQGRIKPSRKLPGRTGAFLFRRVDIEALAASRRPGGQQLDLASA